MTIIDFKFRLIQYQVYILVYSLCQMYWVRWGYTVWTIWTTIL